MKLKGDVHTVSRVDKGILPLGPLRRPPFQRLVELVAYFSAGVVAHLILSI